MGDGLERARGAGPDRRQDADLVERARVGDGEAFGALVRRHLAIAFATARPLVPTDEDAEDVCQDAFIKALERLEDCRDPEHFRAWLLTIVKNRAHNYRKYLNLRRTEELDPEAVSGANTPERTLEQVEIRARATTAVNELTELQRSVLILHDYEGWKHAEIGERLGISEGGSRFHLHAARKRMRGLLPELAPHGRPEFGP